MRAEKVMKNGIWGSLYQILTIILGFVGRTVFIKCLSAEYLGISGLFTNVLTVLSMSELGFSTAITYHLYGLIAKKDETEIAAVIRFYRNVYRAVAAFIFVVGMAVLPFLKYIVKDTSFSLEYVSLVYIICLMKSVVSYFFSYKQTLAKADQNSYILVQIDMVMHIVMSLTNIIVLFLFHNYIIYLIVEILLSFLARFLQSRQVDKHYPYIKKKAHLSKDSQKKIMGDVKNIFFGKISSVIVTSTDNILISILVNTVTVGLYSNYSMIIGYIQAFINQFTTALYYSMGNMFATETKEYSVDMVNKLTYILYFGASFCACCLFGLLNPFISLWIGSDYLLDISIVAICVLNFFIQVLKTPLWNTISGLGYFKEDRNIAIWGAISNLGVSIILGYFWGILGIFIGTAFSQITQWGMKTVLMYGKYVQKSPLPYLWLSLKLTLLTIGLCAGTYCINSLIQIKNEWIALFIKAAISVVIPIGFNLIFFWKNEGMIYIRNFLLRNVRRAIQKKDSKY